MARWLTSENGDLLVHLWKDAPMDDEVLDLYLSAAKSACLAYARPLPAAPLSVEDGYVSVPPSTDIPDEWVLAQVMQARNTFNAGAAGPGGDMDGSGYGITAHPLDWQVKQLLNPQTRRGAIW